MRRLLLFAAYAVGVIVLYLAFVFGREFVGARAKRTEYAASSAEVRADLEDAARQLREKTPFMIDASTRLDSVEVENERMYYRYSFPTLTAKDIDRNKLLNQTRAQLVEKACSNAKLRLTLKYGARYVHSYAGNDGELVAEIEIEESDCGTRPNRTIDLTK